MKGILGQFKDILVGALLIFIWFGLIIMFPVIAIPSIIIGFLYLLTRKNWQTGSGRFG
jgi:uncharacterized membrane protein